MNEHQAEWKKSDTESTVCGSIYVEWHKSEKQFILQESDPCLFQSEGGSEINGKKGEYFEVMEILYTFFLLCFLDYLYL